jgi:cell division protease FtsH
MRLGRHLFISLGLFAAALALGAPAANAQNTLPVSANPELSAAVQATPKGLKPLDEPVASARTLDATEFEQLLASKQARTLLLSEDTPEHSRAWLRMNNGTIWLRKVATLDAPGLMALAARNNVKALVEESPRVVADAQSASRASSILERAIAWIPFSDILQNLFFVLVLVAALVFAQTRVMRVMGAKQIRPIKPSQLKVRFDDIAGINEAVRDMREAVAFLAHPQQFESMGAQLPKGILLVGPPGGGKTMMAKAFAKECDAPFYSVSGSEFVEMFVGLGAARIRSLFAKARKSKKAVIFIDEIDALAKKRGGMNSHSEGEQTLNELLVQMDGLVPGKSSIIVIAATNRVDAMDEAILRPGRFDRQIHVAEPSMLGRRDVFKVYLRRELEQGCELDVEVLARVTPGFSAAQIANLINEARIRAARSAQGRLTQTDLLAAREKLLLGDPRKDVHMSEAERRNTAYHEAGHAIVAKAASEDPVEKVTIEPRAQALGVTLQVPERDALSLTTSQAHARLLVLMGGRAAEEIFMHDITSGASSDMARAFDWARSMVSKWGMGKVLGTTGVASLDQLSPGLREAVEREALDLVNASYARALSILLEHHDVTETLTQELLRAESVDRVYVDALWAKRKTRDRDLAEQAS